MSTPVFNIVNDNAVTVDWQQCRLIVEINPNYFYYTVLNQKNAVVALKYYQLVYNNSQEMIDLLEEIAGQDIVLKEQILFSRIIFNWPENCLVPASYFDKSLNEEMLTLMHGNISKTSVLSEKVESAELFVIYRIPSILNEFLQRIFPSCTYLHYYSLWLENKSADEHVPANHVAVIFNHNEVIVGVFIDKKLQVIQNLQYQTPDDIAWYLINIYQRFDLKQEETPLLVGGMIDQNSAMFEELLKYFQSVELDVLPKAITVPEQFQSFPGHFFSPLLKLALCVS